jgi:predicted esterase
LSFIHAWKPGAPGKPTLLLFHGTGGTENDFLDVARSIAPGWSLLAPRGKVDEHGSNRFFRRLAEGVFDEEDLVFRTNELADWLEEFAAEHDIDLSLAYGMGYSNGANIAGSLMLLRPNIMAGAILLRPMKPLDPTPRPNLSGKKVLMMAGERDRIIPGASTLEMHELLRELGADVELLTLNAGHELTRTDFSQAAAILADAEAL